MCVTLDSIVLGPDLVAHNNLVVLNCCAFDRIILLWEEAWSWAWHLTCIIFSQTWAFPGVIYDPGWKFISFGHVCRLQWYYNICTSTSTHLCTRLNPNLIFTSFIVASTLTFNWASYSSITICKCHGICASISYNRSVPFRVPLIPFLALNNATTRFPDQVLGICSFSSF